MALKCIKSDVEGSVICGDRIRIVPFKVLCRSVPDIGSFEKWIVARIKGATRFVEFVRELF